METLLKPGDMIRIRKDIKQSISYKMLNDKELNNTWIKKDMLPPETLVEIINISSGQYVVRPLDKINRDLEYIVEDDFWLYTDEMFDPEMLAMLTNLAIEENYFNL